MRCAFALACAPDIKLWAPPQDLADLFRMTPVGAGIAASLYLAAALIGLWRTGRRPGLRASLALLALPFVFNLLLALGSPLFDRAAAALAPIPLPIGLAALRGLALFGFNEATAFGACIALGRRAPRGAALHGLLLAAAFGAAVTPIVAELGSSAFVAHLFAPLDILLASAAAAIAQAGPLGEVYLVTAVLGDILHGAPPVAPRLTAATRSGAAKGAMFGGVFMALLLLVAAFAQTPDAMAVLRASSWMGAALAGALLFPLGRTILESTDCTPPFPGRLRSAYRGGANYAAGAVAGAGVAIAFAHGAAAGRRSRALRFRLRYRRGGGGRGPALRRYRRHRRGLSRTTARLASLCAWGAARRHPRRRHQLVFRPGPARSGRRAFPRPCRGELRRRRPAGNALCDHAVLLQMGRDLHGSRHRRRETVLSGIAVGRDPVDFRRAAVQRNLFLLTALLTRSTAPIKRLFSAEGMRGLADNAIVVLRWGLWMAPIIYAFLKVAPDPQWYNQDGLVRTGVATFMNATMPAGQFRDWSLSVFTALLTYDWLRVLIWFDHMGLRVATLVNFPSSAATWPTARGAISGRARAEPGHSRGHQALRHLGAAADSLLHSARRRMGQGLDRRRNRRARADAAAGRAGAGLCPGRPRGRLRLRPVPADAAQAEERRRAADHRQRAAVARFLWQRRGPLPRRERGAQRGPIDMTRAPDDPEFPRGAFLYFLEHGAPVVAHGRADRLRFRFAGSFVADIRAGARRLFGLRCEARIEMVEGEALALTRLKLVNTGPLVRRLRICPTATS